MALRAPIYAVIFGDSVLPFLDASYAKCANIVFAYLYISESFFGVSLWLSA